MRRVLLSAVLYLAACTIPDPTQVPLRCDDANPCPSGRVCASGQCSDPSDMATTDGAVADGSATGDMLVPDMGEPNGCANGNGSRLDKGQWRCMGAFGGTNPKASALCASGFKVCDSLTSGAQQACNALPGFFASQIIGSRRDGMPYGVGQCDQRELHRVVYGCGNGLTASMACSGFDKLIDCNQQFMFWTCDASIDSTMQKNASNGVLCCRT